MNFDLFGFWVHSEKSRVQIFVLGQGLVQHVICILFIVIQDMHKRMVRVQKLTRNLFLILHGHNVHRQQRQLSRFLMRYQQFASHAYCGAAGPVSKMASQQEKAFCVLRYEVSRSVITVHEKRTSDSAWETWTVAAAGGVRCARVRWEINFLVNFWNRTILLYTSCIIWVRDGVLKKATNRYT